MMNERINIGTYDKAVALGIREQVKKFAKLRKQKVKVIFRGRGKKLKGYNDGNMKAKELATYLEVYGNGDILADYTRDKMIGKIIKHKGEYLADLGNADLSDMLRKGFKGYNSYSSYDLINELLRLV